MSLEKAMNRLDTLLAAPTSWTRGTKIYEPEDQDPNAAIKRRLIRRATNAMDLARQNMGVPVGLLENDLFFAIEALPESDAEKAGYLELFNATQAVLGAINEDARNKGSGR